jgi:uncharacterized membrane protein (UPF0182 family)
LGVTAADWRSAFLQFVNPTTFGVTDPLFNTDLSFFVFRLPFWTLLVSWAFNVVALTTIFVAALHYLNGGIRFQRGSRPTIRSGVKSHISALAALLAVLRAVGYWFDRYDLMYTTHDQFFGAGFTDVNARLPALQLLMLVSLAAAVLFLLNIRRPGWTLALVSVGAWLFVSVAAGAVYPTLVQRFQVDPGPLVKETPFIQYAIDATRAAYGFDKVEKRDFAASSTGLVAADVQSDESTLAGLRLWDPDVITRTYQNLQEIRPYYRVDHVDTDRYSIDGTSTQVMIASRELDEGGLPEQNWQTTKLIYTHGFGVVLSPANAVESDGQPTLTIEDVPPKSTVFDVEDAQTRIYFGESYSPGRYVIVKTGTTPQEADFPLANTISKSEYDGKAGVELSSIFRRLAFALRFRDLNILISGELRPDSRIIMERNIRTITQDIAPFLAADADPYPVLLDGHLSYVLDLYTVSQRYPYSQPWTSADTLRLAESTGLPRRGYNYIRNSVKATIDAYDGTVRLYVPEGTDDPLIDTWRKAYPGAFLDASEMPTGMADHLRYPQDMFKIQGELYKTYHQTDVNDFFNGGDAWSIPPDPSTPLRTPVNALIGDVFTATGVLQTPADGVLPYYVTMNLPGDETPGSSYVLLQSFNVLTRPNMSSFLVADSTPSRYGRLIEYRMPRGSLVEGTGQVGQRIEQNSEISQQFTLWDQRGSKVLKGDMLLVPIKDSLLYIQPIYLEASAGGLPEFRRVVVVYGDAIQWDTTLQGALAKVFGGGGGTTPPETGGDGGPVTPPSGTVAELLAQAEQAFQDADDALKLGDLATYQDDIQKAQDLVSQALAQMGDSGTA